MKSVLFFLAFVGTLLAVGCKKSLADICFETKSGSSISTPAITAAGAMTATKSLGTGLADAIKAKGVDVSKVNKLRVAAVSVTIDAAANFTFADMSDAELLINGVSAGKLPAGATGLVQTFTAPTSDFKSLLSSTTAPTATFNATFKKAVAASSIAVSIPFNPCYNPL